MDCSAARTNKSRNDQPGHHRALRASWINSQNILCLNFMTVHHWCLLNGQDWLWEVDLFCNGGGELRPWDGIFCHPPCYGGCYTGWKQTRNFCHCAWKYLLPMKATSQTAGLGDEVMCNLSPCFCSSFFLAFLPMWFTCCSDLRLCILLWSEIQECRAQGEVFPRRIHEN